MVVVSEAEKSFPIKVRRIPKELTPQYSSAGQQQDKEPRIIRRVPVLLVTSYILKWLYDQTGNNVLPQHSWITNKKTHSIDAQDEKEGYEIRTAVLMCLTWVHSLRQCRSETDKAVS
jgi:hypothetical protein